MHHEDAAPPGFIDPQPLPLQDSAYGATDPGLIAEMEFLTPDERLEWHSRVLAMVEEMRDAAEV